jgi:glucose-1-phosphate thymidylyltransferase
MTDFKRDTKHFREVIGLLPAAGLATRISPLPLSKELYPIGFQKIDGENGLRPKVISHYLLEKMRIANIKKAYFILRNGKWDIPSYFGDGKMLNMHIAYLIMNLPFGVPYTLDQAYPFVEDVMIALGFPDIIFQPDDAFVHLLNRQCETNSDVVLGVFHANDHKKWDMVDITDDGRIRQIVIRPVRTDLRYAWGIAVWTPVFTNFMHEYLANIQNKIECGKSDCYSEQQELSIGDIIKVAVEKGLKVEGVLFPDNTCLDIGTPEDLLIAVQNTCNVSDESRREQQ